MRSEITRHHYERKGRRYASDATDAEWALIEGLLPPAKGGGRPRTTEIRHAFPWLRHVFADGGHAGPKLEAALAKIGRWTREIVRRSEAAIGFELLPRRRVVERSFAWLGRCRRLAKDGGETIASAWLLVAHIRADYLLQRTGDDRVFLDIARHLSAGEDMRRWLNAGRVAREANLPCTLDGLDADFADWADTQP